MATVSGFLATFLCKKVISHCMQLLTKPSGQFLFVIIPLTFAFSGGVYGKRNDGE